MTPGLIGTVAWSATLVAAASACAAGSESIGSTEVRLPDRGAVVYEQSCASCHGVDLRGTDKGPSHLSILYEPAHHSDEVFRGAIANGAPQHHWSFGDMAPIEGLSESDVEAVISFIRAEQQRLGFEK